MQATSKPRFIVVTAVEGAKPYSVRMNPSHIVAYSDSSSGQETWTTIRRVDGSVVWVKETQEQIDQLIDLAYEL